MMPLFGKESFATVYSFYCVTHFYANNYEAFVTGCIKCSAFTKVLCVRLIQGRTSDVLV